MILNHGDRVASETALNGAPRIPDSNITISDDDAASNQSHAAAAISGEDDAAAPESAIWRSKQ